MHVDVDVHMYADVGKEKKRKVEHIPYLSIYTHIHTDSEYCYYLLTGLIIHCSLLIDCLALFTLCVYISQ